ncbi:MAG: desulfoferrodoxin family protein [Candidatus Sulfobium sp.]
MFIVPYDPADRGSERLTYAEREKRIIDLERELRIPFTVEVSIGEVVHPMGPEHGIEHLSLSIGNEPAGRVSFQSRGYLQPKAAFTVVLTKESAPAGKATLVIRERCNIHGYWENSRNVTVI